MTAGVLLIGGLGYVGYNLARHYVAAGVEVVVSHRSGAPSRRPGIAAALRSLGARLLRVEGPDELATWLRETGCPRTVFTLVGRIRGSGRELWLSNYQAAVALTRAALGVCRRATYVLASSIAVYGVDAPRRCGAPVVEEPEHCSCCRPRSAYARAKLEAERALIEEAGRAGAPLVAARMGIFAGRRPYHPEWRTLLGFARLGLYPRSDIYIHVTTAEVLAATTRLAGRAAAVNAISHRVRLASLARTLALHLSGRGVAIPFPGRRTLGLLLRATRGPLADTAWSFSTPVASRHLPEPSEDGAERLAEELVAEPPEP